MIFSKVPTPDVCKAEIRNVGDDEAVDGGFVFLHLCEDRQSQIDRRKLPFSKAVPSCREGEGVEIHEQAMSYEP